MNQYSPYVKTYKNQRVETASPEAILIMLYEGAIRFLNVAKKAHQDKDMVTYHNQIIKAQQIVFELMTALDLKIGGEIAQNLYALYEYLHYQLIQADMKRDLKLLEEVLTHLRELKSTWEQAIQSTKKETADPAKGAAAEITNVYNV